MEHSSRPELLSEPWILRLVRMFRFFLCVQMIKISEELVESVNGREMFITVTQVILTKLPGGVAKWPQQILNRRIILLYSFLGAGQADFQQSGT